MWSSGTYKGQAKEKILQGGQGRGKTSREGQPPDRLFHFFPWEGNPISFADEHNRWCLFVSMEPALFFLYHLSFCVFEFFFLSSIPFTVTCTDFAFPTSLLLFFSQVWEIHIAQRNKTFKQTNKTKQTNTQTNKQISKQARQIGEDDF
jgi:hypothetical protein